MELKIIDKTSLPQIIELFENKEFYFKSKRPNSINEGLIKRLVFDSNEKTYGIFIDGVLEGIAAFEKDSMDFESVYLHVRCRDMKLLLSNVRDFTSQITKVLKEYKYFKIWVYELDEQGNELCKHISCTVEAIFKQHVYKFGNYLDVYLYCKEIG